MPVFPRRYSSRPSPVDSFPIQHTIACALGASNPVVPPAPVGGFVDGWLRLNAVITTSPIAGSIGHVIAPTTFGPGLPSDALPDWNTQLVAVGNSCGPDVGGALNVSNKLMRLC